MWLSLRRWDNFFAGKSDGILFVSKIDRGNSHTVPGRRCVSCMCLWLLSWLVKKVVLNIICVSFHIQGESNGSVSISEDHTAEVEAHEIGNLSKSSQESYKKHTQYDFHDEQVRIYVYTYCTLWNLFSSKFFYLQMLFLVLFCASWVKL